MNSENNQNIDTNSHQNPDKKEPLLLLPPGRPETPESPFINGDKWADESTRDAKTGRFLPGYEGGPGRPVGSHKMAAMIEDELQEKAAKDTLGNPLTIKKALIKKIVKMALGGDRKMIELIWNYQDGKPPQYLDVTSKGQRIGKRKISDEQVKRIEDLFAPKEWDDEDSTETT